MVGGRAHNAAGRRRAPGAVRAAHAGRSEAAILLGPTVAVGVSTAVLTLLALFNLDDVSSSALTDDGFKLAAAVFFFAAGILRLARWRLTDDPHSAPLAGAMFVLGLLTFPLGNIARQVLHDPLEPNLALTARVAGTALCVFLALRALTAADPGGRVDRTRTTLAAAAAATLGIAGISGLVALAPTTLSGSVVPTVVADAVLAGAWLVLGLAAARRDVEQPWAGRVAPLYASLGVVEILHILEQVQPGSWSLAAVALLGSVAMITAHCAFVDLQESARLATSVARGTVERSDDRITALADTVGRGGPAVDFDVNDVVTETVAGLAHSGQEVRVRGGNGIAHGRPDDLREALGKLLDNAHLHAPASPVTVHVVAIGSRIEISVTDRGPGLSAATAERALASAEAGRSSGLGLHVAQALMARNWGTLELRNRIGGATFVLALPAAADQRTAPSEPVGWDVAPHGAGSAVPQL